MLRLCTAIVTGHKGECQRVVPVDSEISLCARHLLVAVGQVNLIGKDALIATVKHEEARR